MIYWILVGALVFVPMLVEAMRASQNERAQRRRGGVEAHGDVFAIMRVAYPASFLAMLAEGMWHGEPSTMLAIAGASIFAAAKALKWWAIGSLGGNWTFRVIVVPGMSLVHSGPYRFIRHPNYLAVVGELIGTWCMTAATFAGPVATLAFSALMLKRINVEARALDAILRRG